MEANAWIREISQAGNTSSPKTLRTYGYHLFDFFSFLEARCIDWREVTNDNIFEYRDTQDTNPSPHTKRYLNRRTINARLTCVGRYYDFAFDNGWIASNPLKYKEVRSNRPKDSDMLAHLGTVQTHVVPAANFGRLARSLIKWCPHSQVMKWLNTITAWEDKLIAKLLYRLGLRREEVVNLRIWELPEKESVNDSLREVPITIIGKGRKSRTAVMPIRDFYEIHDYIKIIRAKRVRKFRETHDFIFVGKKGRPLPLNAVNRMFDRTSKKCDIRITPHMLRHSFAVFALQHWRKLGLPRPEKLLQARLGHTSITTTSIYMHQTDEEKAAEARANASLIEELIRGEL